MIFKKIINSSIVLLFTFSICLGTVENSVIPLMEKFELIENLPIKKYSDNQYSEIVEVLNHKNERLRLVSYNMLFNLYDQNLDEVNRWPQRLPRIVELIEEMQPDIIGVQELYQNQLDDLLPYINDTFKFYSKPCGDGEFNGIFYRKDRFEILDSTIWYMTEGSNGPGTDTLTMLKLKDLKTNQVFAVFNSHLAFSKINKRESQARFIAEHVAPFAKQIPVIFTGDLNTFPNRLDLVNLPAYDGDYIHRILTKDHLKDAKETALLGHLGPLSTFTNVSDDGVPFTGLGTPGVFLDHIYVSKGITVLLHAVHPGTVNGHFPSDHMPVLMDFILE